jgi:hypothetical protein
MNADGVMNSVLLTSIRSELLTWPGNQNQFMHKIQIAASIRKVLAYINNLEIFFVLLHKKLLIKLLNEINLSISVQQLSEGFQRSSILY